jgi:predicted metal-dependent HD superfamily phosphohydrolase
MVAMTQDLVDSFVDAVGAQKARPVAVALLARWQEPHRRYHTVKHLRAVLDAVDLLLGDPDAVPVRDHGAVRLAAWYHDSVYRGVPGQDEEDSAALAEHDLMKLRQPPERVTEVARLVRLTADHRPAPDDPAGQVLADADLAVLGAASQDYRAYADAVRAEYAHVPDAAFRAGRAAVLRRLAAADPLFRTPTGRRLWEARARANLAAELTGLES